MRRAVHLRAIAALAGMLAASGCATVGGDTGADLVEADGGKLLDSHLSGFAMAHCLRSLDGKGLPEPEARVLREQGQRWIQILVQKSRGDITLFFAIMPAVDAALAAGPIAQIRDDATGGTLPAPVFHCDALLRQPEVERAMAAAKANLSAAYSSE